MFRGSILFGLICLLKPHSNAPITDIKYWTNDNYLNYDDNNTRSLDYDYFPRNVVREYDEITNKKYLSGGRPKPLVKSWVNYGITAQIDKNGMRSQKINRLFSNFQTIGRQLSQVFRNGIKKFKSGNLANQGKVRTPFNSNRGRVFVIDNFSDDFTRVGFGLVPLKKQALLDLLQSHLADTSNKRDVQIVKNIAWSYYDDNN